MKSLDILFLLDSSLFVLETETRLFFLPSRKFSPFSLSLSLSASALSGSPEKETAKRRRTSARMDKKEEEPAAAAAKPINVRLAAFAHFLARVCSSRIFVNVSCTWRRR